MQIIVQTSLKILNNGARNDRHIWNFEQFENRC